MNGRKIETLKLQGVDDGRELCVNYFGGRNTCNNHRSLYPSSSASNLADIPSNSSLERAKSMLSSPLVLAETILCGCWIMLLPLCSLSSSCQIISLLRRAAASWIALPACPGGWRSSSIRIFCPP